MPSELRVPSVASSMRVASGDRTTRTGHRAWSARWVETDPSTILATGPDPAAHHDEIGERLLARPMRTSAALPNSTDVSTPSPCLRSASARSSRMTPSAMCSDALVPCELGPTPILTDGSTTPIRQTRVPSGHVRRSTNSHATSAAREPSAPIRMRIFLTSAWMNPATRATIRLPPVAHQYWTASPDMPYGPGHAERSGGGCGGTARHEGPAGTERPIDCGRRVEGTSISTEGATHDE